VKIIHQLASPSLPVLAAMVGDNRLVPSPLRPIDPQWRTDETLALHDSVAKGYPIGQITVYRAPFGKPPLGVHLKARELVIDGHERLCALIEPLYSGLDSVWYDVGRGVYTFSGGPAGSGLFPLSAIPSTLLVEQWVRAEFEALPNDPRAKVHAEGAWNLVSTYRDLAIPVATIIAPGGFPAEMERELYARLNPGRALPAPIVEAPPERCPKCGSVALLGATLGQKGTYLACPDSGCPNSFGYEGR